MQKMQFLVLTNISFLGNCFQAELLTKTKSKLTLVFEITWHFSLSCFKVCMGGLIGLVNAFFCSTSSGKRSHAGVSGLDMQG